MRKRLPAEYVVRGHEIGKRNAELKQERNRKAAVVGIAVVERDGSRRPAVAFRANSQLRFRQRHDVESCAQPVDLPANDLQVIVQGLGDSSATRW